MNIIREDVISLGFDIDLSDLNKLQKELNDLKKKLTGGLGEDSFDDVSDGARRADSSMKDAKNTAGKLDNKLRDLGRKGAATAFNGLKKIAGISFKALLTGVTASAGAVAVVAKQAVSAYADYEQLAGGMETLLGAKGAKSVEEYAKITGKSVGEVKTEYESLLESEKLVMHNANNAFKTAGLSANAYMETVTSFSAALKNSLGGDTLEAAKLADVAIQDMADNANKMGTPMESVQTVYSNLARGMFMTLDNLKLGYAGSKEGAMQMVNDAAKIDKSVKANDISYANLVKAIHAVQVKMDIYGTTSKEAFGTITGSLSAFKAAWGNLLPAMIKGGDELDNCIDNLVGSIVGFEDESGKLKGGIINNLMPAIEKALGGIGTLIEKLAPIIEEKLPDFARKLLPPLIKAAVSLTNGLIKALPSILKTLATTIVDIFGEQFPIIKKIGDFFANNADKMAKFIPVLIGLVAAFKMLGTIKAIGSLFGGGDKEGESGGGLLGGITKLAKMKTTEVLKGMANLAIIIGGFVVLGGMMALVAPIIAEVTDFAALAEMFAVIAIVSVAASLAVKPLEIASSMKVTSVLKGLANLAIVMGGFTLIAVAFMAAAPLIAQLGDVKSIYTVIGIITVLGVVGTVLTIFAGIVGKIPVLTVVKGLANMAIIIAGMTALVLLIGAASLINFNYKRMLALVGILGVLGTVGAALTIFAGICGLIPIPVVLAGLANMALVMAGLTALVVAFGALSKIEGLSEFLAAGGELLAQLFGIIGKIAGSLIGNLGEAISDSLPAIGTNLAKFGQNIKPLFEAFSGVDMRGVGSFFSALGGFLLQVTGNNIMDSLTSWFTGGSSFEQIGKDLTALANGAEGFFTKVSTFPENSFANATKLFESLSKMGGLPNSGGVVGWLCGDIDYTKIAGGLNALRGEGVKSFFAMVAEIAPETFDKVTQLFESLSGLGGLPNSGGLAGWFSGEVNYTNIAAGLAAFGSDDVKKFFTMASELSPQAFTNVKLLFDSLSGMSDSLPEEEGWWDKLWGNGKVTLGDIAADLGTFEQKSKSFFAMVNSLNLSNLNGLWESLKNANGVTANFSKKIDKTIDELVEKISKLPKKMGDALRSGSESLSTALVEIWKDAVESSVAPVNKLLSGANHILKEFGSKKRVIEWQPYARGTNGHKGGNALVNDGNGAELVQMPNGHTFIPNGRNVFIPNAPKGMKVLPANQTARLMGKNSPTFRYADGIGNIDIWSYYDNPHGLIDAITKKINYGGMNAFASNLGQGMVSTFAGEMPAWVEKLFSECGQSISSYVSSKGVTQWLPTVVRALKMEGQYSLMNVARTLFQMKTESGGNPRAINLWDKNAKKGTPSKGLMQVIDPTFKAYARNGFDKNIYDPLSNILASVRYATSRYGSLKNAYRGVGYSNGVGTINLPTQTKPVNLSYTPESDSQYYSSNKVENNTYAPQFIISVSGSSDDKTLAKKIKKVVKQAIDEVLDEADRQNPSLVEV